MRSIRVKGDQITDPVFIVGKMGNIEFISRIMIHTQENTVSADDTQIVFCAFAQFGLFLCFSLLPGIILLDSLLMAFHQTALRDTQIGDITAGLIGLIPCHPFCYTVDAITMASQFIYINIHICSSIRKKQAIGLLF
jgi:hypothetical protein